MKLAIAMVPATGRISPVFEVSAHLLLVKLCRSGECTVISGEPFSGEKEEKIAALRAYGVKVLLCGAICNETLDEIKSLGIQVFPFVSGDWREVVKAWVTQDAHFLDAYVMPGCCKHHRECCRHQGKNRAQKIRLERKGKQGMKIALTTRGDSMDSAMDTRFGRAANFFVYDTENQTYEIVPNEQNLNAAQGAGIQAATTVAKTGAKVVITGHCGPKAYRVLEAAGIRVFLTGEKTVLDALSAYQSGKLQPSTGADVEGHWA